MNLTVSNLTIPSYLVILTISGFLVGFVFWRKKERMKIQNEKIFDLIIVYLLISIIVGRMFYVIDNIDEFKKITWSIYPYFYEPGAERLWFRQLPWGLIKIWDGGINYSALLWGGTFAILIRGKQLGLLKKWGNVIVKSLFYSHAFQIIGFLAGSYYFGKITELAIGIQYPKIDDNFRLPIQIIEIVLLLVGFLISRLLKRIQKGIGLIGLYLFFFSWVEVISIYLQDEASSLSGSSIQFAYILLVIVGLIGVVFSIKKVPSPKSLKQIPVKSFESDRSGKLDYNHRDFTSSYKSYHKKSFAPFGSLRRRLAKVRTRLFGGKSPEDRTQRKDNSTL